MRKASSGSFFLSATISLKSVCRRLNRLSIAMANQASLVTHLSMNLSSRSKVRFSKGNPVLISFCKRNSTHRETLKLPFDGKLEPRQINAAFRRLAQKAHPDVGGSHEEFVRITEARNALLEYIA